MEKFTTDKKICLLNASRGEACLQSLVFFDQIGLFFKFNDYPIEKDPQQADILIFNTCGVTDAITKININSINQFVKSGKRLIVFGCLCKVSPEIKNSGSILIPSEEINRFSEYFQHTISVEEIKISCEYEKSEIDSKATPVFISQGCLNHCSFCNIKLAKGHVKSRSTQEIVEDVMLLIKQKRFEIVLISDDCGSYGYDIDKNTNIATLIDSLLSIDPRIKIKIYNIYPRLFLIHYPALKGHILSKRITYLLIPLQSGSNRILRLMNRSYDLDLIMDNIKEMKKINPDVQLFSHFIFNFPTETTEDFKKTIDLCLYFDHIFFTEYGENTQTPAAKIFPKCSLQQLQIKKDIFDLYKKKGLIKGEFVSFSR